jgi:hypothetical protein
MVSGKGGSQAAVGAAEAAMLSGDGDNRGFRRSYKG